MSTLTMPSSARQPFASLSGSRLRDLTNIKNKQNAIPASVPSSLKRHVPSEFDEIDTENIDPLMFSSPSKKSRNFDFDISKSSKAPLFALTPAKKPSQYVERAPVAGIKRKAEDSENTPINTVQSNKRKQPSSAPAGRSPKNKKIGILSRRRMTASPFTRVNPPTTDEGNSTGLPFSIDAALAGTVPIPKSKAKSKSTHRKTWQFEIYEDTPEDEMSNLMEHSTCTLDISDDESRASIKGDRDNKENVPPVEGVTDVINQTTQVIASRRDMMTDESRSPLGDLDAKEYYADGCDATSIILIAAEDEVQEVVEKPATASDNVSPASPVRSRANAVSESREEWKDIIAKMAPKTEDKNYVQVGSSGTLINEDQTNEEPTEIQVWESESAKGDNDIDASQSAVAHSSEQPVLA